MQRDDEFRGDDLAGDEPDVDLLVTVATYLRQIRAGEPLDEYDVQAATQADIDHARGIVDVARYHFRTQA